MSTKRSDSFLHPDQPGEPAEQDRFDYLPVDSALDFLVNAARVSPILRDKVRIVDEEIRRLRRWKTEATTVLNYWDIAYEMAHIDGGLGESKPTLMLTEIERLRRRDGQWAADVVWRAGWMTKAVNLLGEIREELEHELGQSGHLSALEDLLHDEFDDGSDDE